MDFFDIFVYFFFKEEFLFFLKIYFKRSKFFLCGLFNKCYLYIFGCIYRRSLINDIVKFIYIFICDNLIIWKIRKIFVGL